jgi:hypothetical protein
VRPAIGPLFVHYHKNNFMSDDKKKTGKQDDIRVDSNDPLK